MMNSNGHGIPPTALVGFRKSRCSSQSMYRLLIRFSLEIKLQSKLDDSSITRRENLTKSGAVAGNIRRSEIGAVEGIEKFSAELEAHPLSDVEVLGEREIEVHIPGS